jgi:hypothetical protein
MKYSTEFKRMQQLAGIQLNEIKVNNPLQKGPLSVEWNQLGKGYVYNGEEYETPQGFIFTYNSDDNTLESEIQYGDWGDDRDEAEAVIDPLLNELENDLDNNDVEYKILATSSAYLVTISFD